MSAVPLTVKARYVPHEVRCRSVQFGDENFLMGAKLALGRPFPVRNLIFFVRILYYLRNLQSVASGSRHVYSLD